MNCHHYDAVNLTDCTGMKLAWANLIATVFVEDEERSEKQWCKFFQRRYTKVLNILKRGDYEILN